MRTLLLTACLAWAVGCTESPAATTGLTELIVRAGTSFGECIGYCTTELRIAAEEIRFTESSWNAARYPERTRRASLRTGEWEEIVALARPDRFAGLREVYGCPDCADGGAEWIEIEYGGTRRRVTFEYGATVGPIQPLIDRTRELRERFPR